MKNLYATASKAMVVKNTK